VEKGNSKMNKLFAVSIVFVLLLPSGTFADGVGQAQGYLIDAGNGASVGGAGYGAVMNTNIATVINKQESSNAFGHLKAVQIGFGSLAQGASAVGIGGLFGAEQDAFVVGEQRQFGNDFYNLVLQQQNLDANLQQDVFKAGNGIGSALAIQSFIGGQAQFMLTPFGASANIQVVGVGLFDSVSGGPANSSVISGGLGVGTD
jgi:hypothetical protein